MRNWLILCLLVVISVQGLTAQEELRQCDYVYMLAHDDQVWRVDLESREIEQLTDTTHNIYAYDFTPDGQTLVFNSDNKLWIQSDQGQPTILSELSTQLPYSNYEGAPYSNAEPTISHDGKLIVYSDWHGLWRIPSEGGEAEQLTENIPPDPNNVSNMTSFYDPQFLPDGTVLTGIGLWEYSTKALVNVETGAYRQVPRYKFSDATVGYNNRFWMYGDGSFTPASLYRASADGIENPIEVMETILPLLPEPAFVPYINHVVEYAPDQLLMLVSWQAGRPQAYGLLHYDVSTNEAALLYQGSVAGAREAKRLETSPEPQLVHLTQISPDGRYILGLNYSEVDEQGQPIVKPTLYTVETGQIGWLVEDFSGPVKQLKFGCQ